MSVDKKTKKKRRRLLGFVFSIASIIILTYISISLITGRGLNFSWVMGIFTPRAPVEIADEFFFDVGRDRVFANLDGFIASVGTLGIQVLDYGGNETLRDTFRMARPAVRALNSRAIAFDIGGTAVRVFDSGNIISAVEASGPIISASINRNGWFTVSTQEGGGLRGVATVYNSQGTAVYRANMGSGYVLTSALSPDNRSFAVLNLADAGSRIPQFHGLNQRDPDNTFVLPGTVIIDIHYLSTGYLLAISTDSLIALDYGGAARTLFDFFDERLGGFIFYDDMIILHLLEHGVGHSGKLLRLNGAGQIQAELSLSREIISMSFSGGHMAVLWSDGITVFDENFEKIPLTSDNITMAGVNRILALSEGNALATGEHVAVGIRN